MANSRPGVSLLTLVNFQMYFNRLHHRDLFSWYFFGNPAEARKGNRYVERKELWVRQDEDKIPDKYAEWSHSDNFHHIRESREKDTMVFLIVHNCSAQGAGNYRSEVSNRLADVSFNARELDQRGEAITAKSLKSTGKRLLGIFSPQV